jgi:hypothetical protein
MASTTKPVGTPAKAETCAGLGRAKLDLRVSTGGAPIIAWSPSLDRRDWSGVERPGERW